VQTLRDLANGSRLTGPRPPRDLSRTTPTTPGRLTASVLPGGGGRRLHDADPGARRGVLFRRAISVGQSHIAATVNTLLLAYLGASLPLLVLFAVGNQAPCRR
jgi:hypothetical protein